MFGEDFARGSNKNGIIPQACCDILDACESRERVGFKVDVSVSFVEIFGDTVGDLLQAGDRLGPSVVAGHRYVQEGRSAIPVSSYEDIKTLIDRGNSNKRRAATAMNERSSRAHSK